MEDLFNPLKAVNATPGEVDLKASALTRRLFKEAKTKEDCLWLVQKMYTLMCYTPECVQQVLRLDPQNKAALLGDIANYETTFGNATHMKSRACVVS